MPVYYDDKKSREKFITEKINLIGYDSTEFMEFVYNQDNHMLIDGCYDQYEGLVQNIKEEFSYLSIQEVISEITSAMFNQEEEYIKAWKLSANNKKDLTDYMNPYIYASDDEHYF